MPLIYIGAFIEHPTPFMEEFLERLTTLNYPLTRLRLFIHNNVGPKEQNCLTQIVYKPNFLPFVDLTLASKFSCMSILPTSNYCAVLYWF